MEVLNNISQIITFDLEKGKINFLRKKGLILKIILLQKTTNLILDLVIFKSTQNLKG